MGVWGPQHFCNTRQRPRASNTHTCYFIFSTNTWLPSSFLWQQKITKKKPADFELSSNMHMYYAFDNHIYSFSFRTYAFLVWQTSHFYLIYANTFEIVQTYVCIQNINAHEVLSGRLEHFNFLAIFVNSHLWYLKYSSFGSHITYHITLW